MAQENIGQKLAKIDEQLHALRDSVGSETARVNKDEIKKAAEDWLITAAKIGKMWPKNAPSAVEIVRRDRRHS